MSAILSRSAAACPQDRYTKLPDALLSVLTPREHQVVHALLSYRWTDASAIYPRVSTLAERLGCKDRTIQRALRGLEAKGYLIIEARYRDDRGQTSNLYRPGPLLVALLTPPSASPVTAPDHDQHHPVSRMAGERYSGNQKPLSRGRQRGYIPTDAAEYTSGKYGRFIHQ